jgi:16S rRNA (guanine1516-N2)-methyltransferase
MSGGQHVAVSWEAGLEGAARMLAARLGLPLAPPDSEGAPLHLHLTAARLELRETGPEAAGPIFVDFTAGRTDYRRRFGGGRGQLIARAVGLRKERQLQVIDATAGLGQDAFVLATLGATVTLVERSTVVGALLEDALGRARAHPTVGEIAARMRLVVGEAREVLEALKTTLGRPDVVYLDPMYPHRRTRSLPKKEMRVFRRLVGDDADAEALLRAALECARSRVVVKRPRGAPPLGAAPSGHLESKNTRFDLYIPPSA